MSFSMITEITVNILQLITLLLVIGYAFILINRNENRLGLVFFTLAMTSFLMSTLYWIAYDLIRPDTRMPLAVNEMGETATYLLLGACFTLCVPKVFELSAEYVAGALFAVANITLWIVWSGEWLQDIIGGIAYGYLVIVVVGRTRMTDAWQKRDRILHAVAAAAVILLFTLDLFFVAWKDALEWTSYAILILITLYSLFRAITALRGNPADKPRGYCLCLSFTAYIWAVNTVYMTTDLLYYAACLLEAAAFPLMLAAVCRESRFLQDSPAKTPESTPSKGGAGQ